MAPPVAPHVAVRIEGLKHAYQDNTVLDIEELDVLEGEILALIGPNGAGKSTLLRLINLLEKPVEGDITYWDGSRLTAISRKKRRLLRLQMAMVFQDALLFKRTVKANISYGLRVRGVPREERNHRVREMLDLLGLSDLADRYALSLSGGEGQKVSLGRALVLKPRILLMDEPFASLDYPSRTAMRNEIMGIIKKMGVTALYVTHDHTEVLEMADRIAVLQEGRIQQVGTPGDIFNSPANEGVAQFIGVETILEGEAVLCEDGLTCVRVNGLDIQVLSEAREGEKLKLVIHPEEVLILRGAAEAGSARNRFPARITGVSVLGPLVKLTLDCGFRLVSYITRTSLQEMGLEAGDEVTAAFKATAVHVIRR